MANPLNYFKGVGREMKRVKWPTGEQFFSSVGVVLVITIFAAIILVLWDLAANSLVEQLRQAFELIK